MCLIIRNQLKAKVARRNFVVIKVLRFRGKDEAYSPYRHFVYKINKEYTRKCRFTNRKSPYKEGDAISIGYHAYLKHKEKRDMVYGTIYKAIIPKGAKYIVGKRNDIVSDKIIIKGVWKNTKK